jgi:hypothetical protein
VSCQRQNPADFVGRRRGAKFRRSPETDVIANHQDRVKAWANRIMLKDPFWEGRAAFGGSSVLDQVRVNKVQEPLILAQGPTAVPETRQHCPRAVCLAKFSELSFRRFGKEPAVQFVHFADHSGVKSVVHS